MVTLHKTTQGTQLSLCLQSSAKVEAPATFFRRSLPKARSDSGFSWCGPQQPAGHRGRLCSDITQLSEA